MKATYFREYGIHSVQNGPRTDHLASFPTWNQLETALKDKLPSDGLIITPELITLDPVEEAGGLNMQARLIADRIDFAKDLTRQTDATLLLGTPQRRYVPGTSAVEPGRTAWHNAAMQIHHGEIVAQEYKSYLLPIEQTMGLEAPPATERLAKLGGAAILICAELYGLDFKRNTLLREAAREAIALAHWATPANSTKTNLLPATEQDAYYEDALEHAVSRFTFPNLSRANRLTVVDRGRPDIPPYNAVFERTE